MSLIVCQKVLGPFKVTAFCRKGRFLSTCRVCLKGFAGCQWTDSAVGMIWRTSLTRYLLKRLLLVRSYCLLKLLTNHSDHFGRSIWSCTKAALMLCCYYGGVCCSIETPAVLSLHADKQMETATNSILAGYCWATKWPHVAKLLEVIETPDFCEDTGELVESSSGSVTISHVLCWCVPVVIHQSTSVFPVQSAFLRASCAVVKVKSAIDGGLADLGTGVLRPRLPNERDKEYERNTSAALLLKTRCAVLGLNTNSVVASVSL